MWRSWKIGSAFGIGIYVHVTFLLVPLWVLFSTWGMGGLAMGAFLLALVGAVFGCVVLHELGHALMARHFGIRTRDITLYPIGGVARLERMSEQPLEEFLIAVAGPAVNVVIAGILAAVLGLAGFGLGLDAVGDSLVGSFLTNLLLSNVILVGFNLIPAFPMDGGRVLRALLSLKLGHLRATEVAANVGAVMAVLIGLSFFLLHNPMLFLVALFVFFAGQQEVAALRRREAARLEEPADVLPVRPRALAEPVPADPGFTGFVWDPRFRGWVFWHNGRPFAAYPSRPE
ncbi:MAG TPA: site-2 protease family protein [Gemmataceae bacterium]|nr:site-2 protease family protein [Gemmataceae bacterium]